MDHGPNLKDLKHGGGRIKNQVPLSTKARISPLETPKESLKF